MSIKVIRGGLLASIQDEGRRGFRKMGIGPGGAMDPIAARVSNLLCGNSGTEPVLEIHFPAPEFLLQQDLLLGIAGADFDASIDGLQIPRYATVLAKKGSAIRFSRPVSGARLYFAVRSGWHAGKWMNSFSTQMALGMGGHKGRALIKEDQLEVQQGIHSFVANRVLAVESLEEELNNLYYPRTDIRCIQGPEFINLDEGSKQQFGQAEFSIGHRSDRMGFRLTGPSLFLKETFDMVSSAVDKGTIQLLPGGDCIILVADHQATGGYPRIASVIKADLPKLAQLKAGDKLRVQWVTLYEAERQLNAMDEVMSRIQKICDDHQKNYLGA